MVHTDGPAATSAASPDDGDTDLDGLIGDVRRLSARLRAAPDFPLTREAAIGAELDRLAPAPDRPRLERLAAAVDALTQAQDDPRRALDVTGVRTGLRTWWRRKRGRVEAANGSLMGAMVADGLRTASGRLADIESRLRRLEMSDRMATSSRDRDGGPGEDGVPDLVLWRSAVLARAGGTAGRCLYAGPDAAAWLSELQACGWDVYALDVESDVYADGDLRSGDLAKHLQGVADSSLAHVVLAAATVHSGASEAAEMARELARTVATVSVLSEAPWWWAERVGPEQTDLADGRPLTPDTWIAVLGRAGFSATASYSPDGRSYLVEANHPT